MANVWIPDSNCMPQKLIDIPKQWQLVNEQTLEGIVLDHCFTGWDGTAKIYWPEYQLGLRILHRGLFKYMVIYIPEGENFFCLEPVSHINNAIHLAAEGIEDTGHFELAPNETASAEVEYKVIR